METKVLENIIATNQVLSAKALENLKALANRNPTMLADIASIKEWGYHDLDNALVKLTITEFEEIIEVVKLCRYCLKK